MAKEDTFKAAMDEILRSTSSKADTDWTPPKPKPIISAIRSTNLYNSFDDVLTSTNPSKSTEHPFELPQQNPAIEAMYTPYWDVLRDYIFHGSPEKSQFFKNDPNVGYKVHLNVLPMNVLAVSNFLKAQEFEHKYLSGGDVEDGKIFTIYLGSKISTEKYVKEIYQSVGNLLEVPITHSEVEYAPRIVGRFVGGKEYFRQYGREGISLLYDLPSNHPLNTPERAREKALEEYGDYFGGGITPYLP